MRLTILLFASLIISPSIYSQNSQFVELKNGTIIEGKVEKEEKFLHKTKLIINDTTEIFLEDVEKFQTSEGYFVRMHQGYGETWAKRIEEGNIDLFTRTVQHTSGGYTMPTAGGGSMYVGAVSRSSQVEFFSKNDGPLMRANAINLKRELSDNPRSMEYLKKRDGLTAVQVIGGIAGIAIGIASVTSQADSEELDPTGAIIGLGVFAGSAWIPYYGKKDLTQQAIREYNNPSFDYQD
jgi:hypothetical protein